MGACVSVLRAPVMGGLAIPRPLGNAALAQFVFLHFTAFGNRQFAYEFQISRNREIGQTRFAKRNQLSFGEVLAWLDTQGTATAYAIPSHHLRSAARQETKPPSHTCVVLRRFRKEVVLAGFAAEAQAPMVVGDKTELSTTV